MEPSVIAALASTAAALIALVGSLINCRKTIAAAKESHEENKKLSKELKVIDSRQQAELATLQSNLDRMTHIFNANYSRRVEVLTEAYAKLAEIKLLMESFVVPLFARSVTGNHQTIRDAADRFEELYKYASMKSVYFRRDSKFMSVLSQLMGHINDLHNIAGSGSQTSWNQQVQIVIKGVNPILSEIAAEVRAELKLDL